MSLHFFMNSFRRLGTHLVVVLATVAALQGTERTNAASLEGRQSMNPQQPSMEHFRFDDAERWAKRFDDPARDEWQRPEHVIAILALEPGQAIADIGAGTGYFAVRIARAQPESTVFAVDIEASMVEYLRQRARVEQLQNVVAVQGSAQSANLPAAVDLALIVDTYHHVSDRVAYFRRLRTSLKPNGRVVIVDHRKDVLQGQSADHRLTVEQMVEEMKQAGYRLDTRHDTLPRQNLLVFRSSE
jgi:ubiquinone/menaquinone biosynthesis C-methylase UbiE